MKKYTLFLLTAMAFLIVSCTSNMANTGNNLNSTSWELEYVTGPRITFQGLYPDEKPMLMFQNDMKTVNGNTSCNSYNTTYTMNGKNVTFKTPAAMTMRYCEGGGEQAFMNAMKQVNKYRITSDGKLELMMNDIVMMRFKKAM